MPEHSGVKADVVLCEGAFKGCVLDHKLVDRCIFKPTLEATQQTVSSRGSKGSLTCKSNEMGSR